jgi:hypothetical protein
MYAKDHHVRHLLAVPVCVCVCVCVLHLPALCSFWYHAALSSAEAAQCISTSSPAVACVLYTVIPQLCSTLLNDGAEVTQVNKHKQTALHLACSNPLVPVEIVSLLLQARANPNAQGTTFAHSVLRCAAIICEACTQ